MRNGRSQIAQILAGALLGSFVILPGTEAMAPSIAPYVFVGNESGGRFATKGNGNGTFGAMSLSFTYGDNNRGGAVEDFDNDGDADFLGCAGDLGMCHLFIQTSPGVFMQSTNVQPSGISLGGIESGMAADDFNQDGKADVLLGGNSNLAAIYFGNGAGVFPTFIDGIIPPISGTLKEKDTGDLDGNGYPDLAIGVASTGEVYSYLNTAGVFSGPFFLFDTTGSSNNPNALAVADFDGDGEVDIIAGGSTDGEVALWKGNGTGNGTSSFTLIGPVYDFDTQSAVDSYDFDNDGDQDLVAVNRATGVVKYFQSNGNGTFQAAVDVGTVTPSAFGIATPPAPPVRSKVMGKTLRDTDGSGTETPGDTGLGGINLQLTGTDYLGKPVSLNATSAPDGTYLFIGVPIDNGTPYALSVMNPPGLPTVPNPRSIDIPRENTAAAEIFLYCTDSDHDGFAPEGGLCGDVDCNDAVASVHPGATEQCNNVDDNCDGTVDEGAGSGDEDADGFSACTGDCNDANASIHPGATEQCNGMDDDCDGPADEGVPDGDGDGVLACQPVGVPGGPGFLDCNDADPAIHPGAEETCNFIDDNCNTETDEGFDQDSDSYSTCGGDCSDLNASINPGMAEQCNAIDDNCDGTVDEGFDADGDDVTTCGGDCNDSTHVGQDASLQLIIGGFWNVGAGNISNYVYVGNGLVPFGSGGVLVPLSSNGTAIVDPGSSSSNVPGIHVLRGRDPVKGPFFRISSYGNNASTVREVFTGNFLIVGGTITQVSNGPNGNYEGQGNGACTTGDPGKDEYTIDPWGSTGTLCSTTNTDQDNVTVYYQIDDTLFCNQITNPAVQCEEAGLRTCGICIHPGMTDLYGDGVDSDCGGVADCGMKKDYDPDTACAASTVVAHNDAELNAYLTNFGLQGGKYQNLKIGYNVSRPVIDIHSPCKIQLVDDIALTGNDVCVDGRFGVQDSNGYNIVANRAAILSELGDADLGMGSTVDVDELRVEGLRHAKIGMNTTTQAQRISVISNGDLPASSAFIRQGSTVTANSLTLKALREARIGPGSTITVGSLRLISRGEMGDSNAELDQNTVVNATSVLMESMKQTKVGVGVHVTATGPVTLSSMGTGPGAETVLLQNARVVAPALSMTAAGLAKLGVSTDVTTTGNFHMDAPECDLASSATVTAGSTSGNCFP